jgi:3',5'-nucleoside bisphosphate phosphatase
MLQFKADLHIHTVLSPCGSLEMSPVNIVNVAIDKKLDIIAITDHNSTKQIEIVQKVAKNRNILVIGGVEVNSLEEVHCLAYFENGDQLALFQEFIDHHLIKVKNKPQHFGYQVVVDENEKIIIEEPWLLINALDVGLDLIEKKVHSLEGLFIPAHIDRKYNGIIGHLGFVPSSLLCDGFELSSNAKKGDWAQSPNLPHDPVLIRNSDAHWPEAIASQYSKFQMEELSFDEIRKAFRNEEGRNIIID